ncbi:MAG: tetratricopeptide repeat protein [Dokdonella sp.]
MHSSRVVHDLPFRDIGPVLFAMLACTLLGACASVRPSTRAPAATMAAAVPVAQSDDVLLKLLSAQFALQDGDLASSAAQFTDAAQLSPNPAVAEEATRLALSVKDWALARRGLARWQQLVPMDSDALQARGWIALGEKRSDDAYADLNALAMRGGEQVWRQIAQALLGTDDKDVSVRVLARLATPEHLSTQETNWVAVSQLAFKLGDKALAQRLADAAVTRFHGDDGYVWSARLALDRGDKQAARTMYADALKRNPKSVRLRGGYAALLGDSGDNAGAARVLASGPQDDVTYAARAAYAARAEDKATLGALYRELMADKAVRSGKRLYLLGQIAEMRDDRNAAIGWYREIPADDERWFDAQMREAVTIDKLGRTDQALDFLHQLQLQVADDGEQLGSAYLLEADLLSNRQRPRDALTVYTRALDTLPDDTRVLYARALLAVDQGNLGDGEKDLRRVIELRPDNAEALNALGYTLADHSTRGDARQPEALDLIERALKLKPDEPAIIDSMGWLRYRMGDLDASLKALRRAYAKQPDADIAAHLGEVLWVKGEHDEARQIWEAGRKKDAKNKSLLEAIKRLTT